MKKICVIILFLLIAVSTTLLAWGFWAHKRINRMAVFALPPPMFGFYKHHIDFITEHAVDPDKRRYAVEGEAARHFIDLDRYGENPFDSIPKKWKDAVAKFGEDSLMAHGIVPWQIERSYYQLTKAFREHNLEKILKYSAEIGHYIGDAHVPLHCTQNYNGQLTDQHGIHGFWESRIPELFGEKYDYVVGRGKFIEDPLQQAWDIVKVSYAAHDSVLGFEKILSGKIPPERKYSYEQKGNATTKVYSYEYSLAYDKMLDGMAERRMRESIHMVASYWFTAWVNAGQPDIESLAGINLPEPVLNRIKNEEQEWKKKKIKTDDHE